MLAAIVPADIFALFLVFVRVGAAMMLLPGFGEASVPRSIRLAFAVALAAVIGPGVAAELPALPETPVELLLLMAGEIAVGLLLGAAARLTMSGLQVAGTVIAFQLALGYAQTVDPAQGTQGAIVSAFFGLLGIILIFASNLHHLIIRAIHDSYSLFQPGALPPVEGFAEIAVDIVAGSFLLGMQIAAPFIIYGLVFYTGLGLLARLMPQFQFFFIAMPLQITISLFILAVSVAAAIVWFLNYYEASMSQFLALG